MANTTISPNMAMPVPVVSLDPGPDWANNYNACLSILDQHNHASGSGVAISQAGILLSSTSTSLDSLSFNSTNAYAVRSVRFTPQTAALALGTDLGCVYESGVDLYYNDGSGNQIRLTQGGSIVGTAGSITGLPSGTASVSYSAGTYVFQSATSTAAKIDGGPLVIRQSAASANGITINSPNSLAGAYSLTLFTALPVGTSLVTVDNTGAMAATVTPTLTSLSIVGALTVGTSASVGTALTVGTTLTIAGGPQLSASGSILISNGGDFYPNTLSYAAIRAPFASSTNTLGVVNSATNVSLPIVTSAAPATNGLMIVRGIVNSNGTFNTGEGFSVSLVGSNYILAFTPRIFADTPTLVVTAVGGAIAAAVVSTSTTNASVTFGGFSFSAFHFIAIGQRAA